MWAITKLRRAGVKETDLKYFFIMKLRSVLESGAAVFHSMLTIEDSDDLERVQKTFCHIVMGPRYLDYDHALENIGLEKLTNRRDEICLNFALNCLKNEKFKNLFILVPETDHDFREDRRTFLEPQCTTERYRKSPLVYLTRQLNIYFDALPTGKPQLNPRKPDQ